METFEKSVYGSCGMVASSQTLASQAGLEILKNHGSALDACISMASVMSVTEPFSTGLGGDCFCLYFDAKQKTIYGFNGSGKTPKNLDVELILKECKSKALLPESIHSVTVPGAVACWVDGHERFGVLSLPQILKESIRLAENGKVTAHHWKRNEEKLKRASINGNELLINGKAPAEGQIFKNPALAKILKTISETGKEEFYKGKIAENIVNEMQKLGSYMTLDDFINHQTEFTNSISMPYKDFVLHESPVNSQGIVALIALGILKRFNLEEMEEGEYYHTLIESLRLAFSDAFHHVTDPYFYNNTEDLLNENYLNQRALEILTGKRNIEIRKGNFISSSDTVYCCAVDENGNACSFINSIYMDFGSGIVPKNCGFSFQNRGCNFSLERDHLNFLQPNKRPYHTIIPAIVLYQNSSLFMVYGVMGGFMQPQGHIQVLLNILIKKLDPQAALNLPRFCIIENLVYLEDGFSKELGETLKSYGHEVKFVKGMERSIFGRGQLIMQYIDENNQKSFVGGSDYRGDGCCIGF